MQKAESFASRALAAKNARKEKETMRTKEERKAQQMEDAKNAQLCGVGAQTRAKATSKEQAQQKEREMEEKRQLEKNAEQARLQQGKEIEQLIEQMETLEMQPTMAAIGNLDMNKCRGAMVVHEKKKLPDKEIEFHLAAAAVKANKDNGIDLNAFDIGAAESGKHVALVIRTEKDEKKLYNLTCENVLQFFQSKGVRDGVITQKAVLALERQDWEGNSLQPVMIRINLFDFQMGRGGIHQLGTEMCTEMTHTMTWDINGWKCDMAVQSPFNVRLDLDSSQRETAGFVKLARMAKMDDTQFERLVYSCIQESEGFEQFRGEMVGVLYDVTRRKGEVIKRLQINDWGGNTRQEAPELRLQVTSQKTKVEMEKTNPSSILYIGAALTENVAVIQVTARKEKERTQVSTTQAQAILKLNEQEQEYRTFITSAIKEFQAACEALLLENGNAPTVENLTMQWKKMHYVAESAMGSVKAFLNEGIEKIESKNWIAGKMWENMTEELGEWAKQVESIIKRERWVVLRISLKNDQKEIWASKTAVNRDRADGMYSLLIRDNFPNHVAVVTIWKDNSIVSLVTGYHAENDEDTPTEIRMQAPGKVAKTFAASVSVCRVPQKILGGRSEELKKAILAIVDRLDGLWVPSTCPRVVNDKSESYPTSDVAGILHPAFGLIAIPKISEMGAAEGDNDIRKVHEQLMCEPGEVENVMEWLGELRVAGKVAAIMIGKWFLYVRKDVASLLEVETWGATVVAGESVNDALLGAVSQELLIAIRLELHTGVWASESIGEAPVKGERIVDQMLKNTRFGKLPHEILWRGLQALQYQAAIVGIAQNEHTVFFHRESIAAKIIDVERISIPLGSPIDLDDFDLLQKTYGGAQAFKQEILKSTENKQGGEFAWVLGKKGKIGFENSSPLSGAGENKRTLTDIVHHEIAYSERQALAVLGKMCQQGIVSIIPVRNDYIVVIARANSDDLARIELQFGKALNSDEVLEMLNDEIFGADISGLLRQQAQHTLRAAQRKILPPFFIANWVKKNDKYSMTTERIAMIDLQLHYSAKIFHPNAYDNESLHFLTTRCKANECVFDTALGTLVLEKKWAQECLVLECSEKSTRCEGGYKCASLANAIKQWNPAQEHLATILSELQKRKRKHVESSLEEAGPPPKKD
jgi:hypothetical protein